MGCSFHSSRLGFPEAEIPFVKMPRIASDAAMRKQGGAEQKMKTIKDEQGAALFERPFRAQETNAPHSCGLEWHFSSMLRLQGRLERYPSSIPRLRGKLERHLSSILRLRSKLERQFSSIRRLRGGLERPFRAIRGSGAGSSSHFELSAAPGWARAAISSHLRLRGGLEQPFRAICGSGPGSNGQQRVKLENVQTLWRYERNFRYKYVYIYIYIYNIIY